MQTETEKSVVEGNKILEGCQHYIYPTNSWGKLPKRKCDKQAVIIDSNGRELCQHHFNKWQNKINKHHSQQSKTITI